MSEMTGLWCTNCEQFLEHTRPVNTSHSSTGDTGCPHCNQATVAYVVDDPEDERNINGAYIPSGSQKVLADRL